MLYAESCQSSCPATLLYTNSSLSYHNKKNHPQLKSKTILAWVLLYPILQIKRRVWRMHISPSSSIRSMANMGLKNWWPEFSIHLLCVPQATALERLFLSRLGRVAVTKWRICFVNLARIISESRELWVKSEFSHRVKLPAFILLWRKTGLQ